MHGGNAGKLIQGSLAGYAQELDPVGAKQRANVFNAGKHDIDLAADQILKCRRCAFVRNVDAFSLGHHLEICRCHMQRGSDTAQCKAVLSWLLLQRGDQFFHIVGREVFAHNQHAWNFGKNTDGGEVFDGIEGELFVEACIHREAGEADQQFAAIGRGTRHIGCGNVSTGSGFVFDNDGFIKQL